ncbi:pentatricopeptide repeat-containing protein 1, mitochondrial [Anoplophora glabripennis]|uniref:pentatricopeptide repeat-containing protein 1, mitochondrial n=1 Tax=Anoplophora glabripennis TaxID=217634 RepID=UPI000873FC79|nr:pentatricopeptide repeat-containing protein 1, mitochondrial [Anoplophora glabripennis]
MKFVNNQHKMFRIRLLKYITQKQFINNVIPLYNNVNRLGCQSISNINAKQSLIQYEINAKEASATNKLENENLTEKEYLVRLKNDPDRFGPPQEKEIIDEGDVQEEKYFTEQPSPSQKLRTKQYADIIKGLIRQRKIKEAIDVVEVRMLKEDRVKPENYLYNLLLGACGRVGYTKKAFKMYNDMKKRGLKVTGGTYTALFNACANSPWLTDGLERATHLRNIMIEKGYEPNDTNYNAMIKAFGRCGDIATAFTLADEMCSKGFKIKDDTINFLLQACIADKDAGFRHALLVWRKLIKRKIFPSVHTYNLMLRCIRDCGLGDIEVTEDVINKILSDSNGLSKKHTESNGLKLLSHNNEISDQNFHKSEDVNLVTENSTDNSHQSESESTTIFPQETTIQTSTSSHIKDLRPNLMARIPHLGSLISLSEVKKPEERLLLVGGCRSFLENMKENNCAPDIKTFTQLLDNIPSTMASEKELLSFMKKFNVKPDIDFFNMLIKKRSMRFDYENAKAVVVSMMEQNYKPNLITYGVLALSCRSKEEAMELLDEMKLKSYHLNIQILGAMLRQACFQVNFGYVLKIMETCVEENVQPNKKFMSILDEFLKKCKKLLKPKELTKSQEKAFGILKARYKSWNQEIEIDESEDVHPWQQYREENDQDVRAYKWKDGTRFKPRHTSLFRKKTSTKHKKYK